MINQVFTIQALSPLHCGVGTGGNDIDLPTARNPVSGHPIVPGSSIKGVLKDEFQNNGLGKDSGLDSSKAKVTALFGGTSSNIFASAISVGDANLVALPVRSFFGTFAYLASPYTLSLLKNLLKRSGYDGTLPEIPQHMNKNNTAYKASIAADSVLKGDKDTRVLLEEMDLVIVEDNHTADEWGGIIAPLYFKDDEGQVLFKQRFVVANDNVLNFVCESGLPVDARTSIDVNTGTVIPGALWYEETVPPETLFSGILSVDRSYHSELNADASVLSSFLTSAGPIYCQLGGKSTTGKGLVALNFNETGV